METQSIRSRLSPTSSAEHVGAAIEAWIFKAIWVVALAWYRLQAKLGDLAQSAKSLNTQRVWLEIAPRLRRARNLARSARILTALDQVRRSPRFPLSPPPSYRLAQLVPRLVRRSTTRIPALPTPGTHPTSGAPPTPAAAALEIDAPFATEFVLSDLVDDDEPTVIDHFISPSARVIDQRRP